MVLVYNGRRFIINGFNRKFITMPYSTIKKLKLTEEQVVNIVMEWYTNGMYPDILQNEEGEDLEEICEIILKQKK